MEYFLDELFDLQMGKTPARNNLEYWNSQDHKWISIGDLSKCGKYISETKEFLSEKAIQESGIFLIPANTVVMSFKLSIGKTAITTEPMYSNEAIMSFRDKNVIDLIPDYIYYLFCSKDWDAGTNKAVMGKTLNKATLSKIKIKVHCYSKQEKIVKILDEVAHVINKRKQQLQQLDELVKARFIELFGDPIRNEKGWPIVTLGEVAEIRIGPFGSLLHKEDYIVGGHALVNPSHIIDGNICTDDKLTVSDEKYEELSAYRLSIGDLVLGRRGEMGRCAVVYEDGLLCGTGSIIIRPKEKMKPYFLQNIISSPGYKRIIEDKAVGVTMMNLNVPIVSSLTIPLLPIGMQEQFIAFMQQTDKSKLAIQQSLDKLETIKKALMQQYFG